ncbi:MAG: glycosyl transferase, group 1 [Chloroflexi bacterium]|jgi:glycosyltransferase involved in cell wall biosynthesis|nr:glycosyl transferase, group 1 [Chloroflexota bacterium]
MVAVASDKGQPVDVGRSPALSILAISPVGVVGGAEIVLLTLLSGLEQRGVRTGLISLGEGPLVAEAALWGLRSVESGPRLSFHDPPSVLSAVRMMRWAARAWRPDVLLSSHVKGQFLSRLALPARRIGRVAILHDPPDRSRRDRLCGRFSEVRITSSEETRRAYVELGVRSAPTVIEPGVDRHRLTESARRGTAEKVFAACGLAPFGGPRILMVGRMQRFKGGLDFIDMADRLLRGRRGRSAQFLLIGPDEKNAPGMRATLAREIASRGLEASVGLGERAEADDLAAAMAQATLLVHPAHAEPFGMVVVEALALGTPVVAYAASGPRRILTGGGGTLVAVGDVAALEANVASALDDRRILDHWRAGTQQAAARFDSSTMTERYLSVLLATSRRHRAS